METLNKDVLERLREVIYELTGNYYPEERLMLLTKKLNMTNINIQSLLKDKNLTKEMLDIITVPETRFFREKIQLETFLKQCVDKLPWQKKGPVMIASYACATGEEVYTLAMMFEYAAIPYKIYGFDINETYLQKAKDGVYPKRHLVEIPQEYQRFLKITDDSIIIKDELKNKVQFKQLNLIKKEDFLPYKEIFDAAFCRNALIYFNDESKLKAIKNIAYTLKMGGCFVVSMTEVLNRIHTANFDNEKINGIFFYKKAKD